MQNRYVGDIGDYLKLGILRALAPGYRLGVAWWLYPDENHNTDGRHIGYLDRPDQWRHYDPDLFDALGQIVSAGQRHVRSLETAGLLPDAIFHGDTIPTSGPITQRRQARQEWFQAVCQTLQEAGLVFLDPDNGLEPAGFSHGSGKAGKSITLAELRELHPPGRCVIVYHHQTRRSGGHDAEIEFWAERLREAGFNRVDALRAKPYSPRVFFLLDAPDDVRRRAEQIEQRWRGLISWHPDVGRDGAALRLLADGGTKPPGRPQTNSTVADGAETMAVLPASQRSRAGAGATTQVGYVNKRQQEVIRPTG